MPHTDHRLSSQQDPRSRVMAGSQRAAPHPPLCFTVCASSLLLLISCSHGLRDGRQERDKSVLLNSSESPAEQIDPAAIDLTPLVNTLINSSQSGSRQLFSLLSVTSYSSLALHKLTLLVYNISTIKNIESSRYRRRFCYCVTNDTNDLTDFTAILLDVIGNSTSYLQELFKSASILSVSQRNSSDCIYICVMGGQMGQDVSKLWDVHSITPLFNRTIVEGPRTGCPWRRPEPTDAFGSGSATTVSASKLRPCVFELCKFFSQCLCRAVVYKTHTKRYCEDSFVWYERHTSEVCRRIRRVSFSRNLKQRCLSKMCHKL
ncbi:HERV-H LTR-associating protein 1 [Brachionichthys hirsutus]|uniref:HERV-H LTR-associating protein 1 n=1 Tax=Brachionichthys hirsutus TaxID=412623 RepID=UPI0036053304